MQAGAESGLVGRLEDGTPYFAPLGQLLWDSEEDRVQCHLCGGWFRFLGSSHLIRTSGRYRIGCERGRVQAADFQRWRRIACGAIAAGFSSQIAG
jgi:hypothetical protein